MSGTTLCDAWARVACVVCAVLGVALAACEDDGGAEPTVSMDAGLSDDVGGGGGEGDASGDDAGGALDAGDTGAGDTGAVDTGGEDAGEEDAGGEDAGEEDAGEDEAPCSASSRWEPEAASANQVIINHLTPFNEIDLTAELDSSEGGALRGRICKAQGETFINNGVFVRVSAQRDNAPDASRLVWFEGGMNGPQQRCTDWEPMDASGVELGAAYTVGVKIVAPDFCADSWSDTCEEIGDRCGYCWHEIALPMARTCAP